MNDQQLNELFRSLPRQDSSHGFTDAVLSRLDDQTGAETRFPWKAAAVVTLAVLLGGLTGQTLIERQQHRDRLDAFRTEQQRIEQQIEELRGLTSQAESLIYLGSDGDTDYVIDLRDVELADSSVRTASYVRGPQ